MKRKKHKSSFQSDRIIVIETAIDDMPPMVYGYLCETLFRAGALDVYTTACTMKKSRPGHLLTVLTEKKKFNRIAEYIFRETSTTGIRFYEVKRLKLKRIEKIVRTRYGHVAVKIIDKKGNCFKTIPEYENCKKIATEKYVPFMKVYEDAKVASRKNLGKNA